MLTKEIIPELTTCPVSVITKEFILEILTYFTSTNKTLSYLTIQGWP